MPAGRVPLPGAPADTSPKARLYLSKPQSQGVTVSTRCTGVLFEIAVMVTWVG